MIAFAKPNRIVALHPNKDNEWYTPTRYLEAARLVIGEIELDPASSFEANQIVRASRYYTELDNGLTHSWNARSIWLNPPYGRVNGSGKSVIRLFVTRLLDEYQSGNVQQAILLTTVQTNSTWFQPLWQYPICFTSHRVAFYKPRSRGLEADSRTSHMLGTAFIYLGSNEQRFVEVFSQFGPVTKRISPPQILPINPSLWEVSK